MTSKRVFYLKSVFNPTLIQRQMMHSINIHVIHSKNTCQKNNLWLLAEKSASYYFDPK